MQVSAQDDSGLSRHHPHDCEERPRCTFTADPGWRPVLREAYRLIESRGLRNISTAFGASKPRHQPLSSSQGSLHHAKRSTAASGSTSCKSYAVLTPRLELGTNGSLDRCLNRLDHASSVGCDGLTPRFELGTNGLWDRCHNHLDHASVVDWESSLRIHYIDVHCFVTPRLSHSADRQAGT